jgi:hypothetical protein
MTLKSKRTRKLLELFDQVVIQAGCAWYIRVNGLELADKAHK